MVPGGLIYDVAFVFGIALYWLPSLVALVRRSAKLTAVVLLNLLLGWTLIGWIVALVMAFISLRRPRA